MNRKYITLQILIAAKMNGKNNGIKPMVADNTVSIHHIL